MVSDSDTALGPLLAYPLVFALVAWTIFSGLYTAGW